MNKIVEYEIGWKMCYCIMSSLSIKKQVYIQLLVSSCALYSEIFENQRLFKVAKNQRKNKNIEKFLSTTLSNVDLNLVRIFVYSYENLKKVKFIKFENNFIETNRIVKLNSKQFEETIDYFSESDSITLLKGILYGYKFNKHN